MLFPSFRRAMTVGAIASAMLATSLVAANAALAETIPEYVTVEGQDWWAPIPGIDDPMRGHLHLAVDLPVGPVSGIVQVNVRVTSHDNLAVLNLLKFQTDDWGELVWPVDHPLANDQPFAATLSIDTTKFRYDGVRLFRFYAKAEHVNGNIQVARPILPVLVQNGNPVKNASGSDFYKPTSWYKELSPARDWGYLQAALKVADLPRGVPVPLNWSPFVRFDVNAADGSPAVADWEVRVDPAFHAGIEGLIVRTGVGPFKGRVPIPVASLTPGAHRLVLIGRQADGTKEHSVVAVFTFIVG